MKVVHAFDDLGIMLFFRPMEKVHDFGFINFFDDMGILLVYSPLTYFHRFAEFLVG